MRVTVDLPDDLIRLARTRGGIDNATLSDVVEGALKLYLPKKMEIGFTNNKLTYNSGPSIARPVDFKKINK